MLWGATLRLVQTERGNAERAALASSAELAATYEAQVVRAVREIDLTLKFVRFAHEQHRDDGTLAELEARTLLPPSLVFVTSIADRDGNIVETTRPLPIANVRDREYFQALLENDVLAVGRSRRDPGTGEWILRFSRRLEDPDGAFAGIAMLSVAADFFVSGYEQRELGDDGVLAILGTDGFFRARRTGNTVRHDETVDYATVVGSTAAEEPAAALTASPWDGVPRFTTARELYDVPLTVLVGLSRAERLAQTDRDARVYVWRAVAGSAALLLVTGLLGGLSWQLAASRRRAVAAQVEHARRVEHLAYHDGLTGLPNRSFFSKLLEQAIHQAKRNGRELAVLFIDLDRFKHINDTLGHDAGDQLLHEVSRRLKACLRESDTVSRLGGDEFVVVLPDLSDSTYAATVAQ